MRDHPARQAGSPGLHRYQAAARAIMRSLGRIELTGVDRVPASGPVLLAANHRSLLDGPLLFGFLTRPVSCLVKREAFVPGVASILYATGQVPVRRGRVDPAPVRRCLAVLRGGGVVGIFPEGVRGAGRCETTRAGVGWLAMRSGATVLPVACHGTKELARTVRRPTARLVVGNPIPLERWPEDRALNRKLFQDAAEQIRLGLARLVADTA